MAVTRLKRKGRKNVSRAKARVATIKRLSAKPVIKNVDIEEMKKDFAPVAEEKPAKKKAAPKKKEEAPVEETPVAEAPAEEAPAAEETPKEEEKKDEE